MVHNHPLVQSVIHNKNTITSVICYTEEQILYIRQFCVKGNCVLGFDKTFNLGGDVHVTPSVFKNLAVIRNDSEDHPIFLGHGSSSHKIYKAFLVNFKKQYIRMM